MNKRTLEEVMGVNVSDEFINKMKNAMCMSAFKYGDVGESQRTKALDRIADEINAFKQDGNLEHMVNVANWAMMRFMFPMGDEKYVGTDSHKSTRKEMMCVSDWLRRYIMEND